MKNPKTIFLSERDVFRLNSHELSFEPRDEYLHASIKGEANTLTNSKKIWGRIASECKSRDYKKVLIEEDVKEPLSMIDVYELINYLPAVGFTEILVAFVDKNQEHSQINNFGEIVGINRGLQGRIFNSVREAETWIETA